MERKILTEKSQKPYKITPSLSQNLFKQLRKTNTRVGNLATIHGIEILNDKQRTKYLIVASANCAKNENTQSEDLEYIYYHRLYGIGKDLGLGTTLGICSRELQTFGKESYIPQIDFFI